MPTSFWKHISYVVEHVRRLKPKSILDIGVGNGKWGFLSREYLDIYGCGSDWDKDTWKTKIDGIEIYSPYINNNPVLNHIYDTIVIGDVTTTLPMMRNYDLMFMMDVLEHVEKDKALILLNQILEKSKTFILSVPLGNWLYDFKGDNKAESHVSIWTEDELINYKKYKEHKVYKLSAKEKEVNIGVFIYE